MDFDDLALLERDAARRHRNLFNRNGALALGAGNHNLCIGGDKGRHAIGGGRTVAQIADHGAAALHLLGANEVCPFNNAGPGFHQGCMFTELQRPERRHRS